MNLHPISPSGQKVKTDAPDKSVDLGLIAKIQIAAAAAIAADADKVLAATALTDSVQTITTGITDPAVPKVLSVTGNQAGVAGNVVVTGTNYAGETITETIALNGASTVNGAKAFREITEIELPVEVNVGTDTVSVGVTEILGIPYKLTQNTVTVAYLDNTKESTDPTVTVSSSALESNTIKLNSTLNGTVVDYQVVV